MPPNSTTASVANQTLLFPWRSCARCGATFEVQYPSSKKKNCSYECRMQQQAKRRTRADKGIRKAKWVAVECAHCGETFEQAPFIVKDRERRKWRLYCSYRCRDAFAGPGSFARGGGVPAKPNHKSLSVEGYVKVYVPPDQRPEGQERKSRFQEHRVVMAQKLGRPLLPIETVHHIDGDKTNNAIENLQLRRGRHGNGAAFRCRDCGSHDIEAVSLASKTEES